MKHINCKQLVDGKNGKMCNILASSDHITHVCPFNCLIDKEIAAEKMCKFYDKVPSTRIYNSVYVKRFDVESQLLMVSASDLRGNTKLCYIKIDQLILNLPMYFKTMCIKEESFVNLYIGDVVGLASLTGILS